MLLSVELIYLAGAELFDFAKAQLRRTNRPRFCFRELTTPEKRQPIDGDWELPQEAEQFLLLS